MNGPRTYVLFVCGMLLVAAPDCALLSKGDQGTPRFFSLERASDRTSAASVEAPAPRADPEELRLGRITGAPHLEERLVFRESPYEILYYRDLRWTEPPELCLERLLARALYEERGLRHVVGGAGPTLDVQLTAFDEIRLAPHFARVQAIVRMHDERLVLWEETLTIDRPIVLGDDGDVAVAAVDALGEAMQAMVDAVADGVERTLEARR